MDVSVIDGKDLTDEHVATWSAIQGTTPELESPFFRPEFTQAISEVTGNVFIGIIHDSSGGPAGFFPFQLERPGFGKGLEMCDYQGLIAPSALKWCAKRLIRKCGLKVWEFDHLCTANGTFEQFHINTHASPIIDVSRGFAAYKAALSSDGRRHLAKAATSARKVEREIGPLTLVSDSGDSQLMQAMHRWRAQKYGSLPEWTHSALEIIRTTRTPAFAGMLSALYAGDRLMAVHFGIRSRQVLHWWFPAYDPGLSNYAPGIQLMLKMAEYCSEIGVAKIDLGKGQQDYKRRFSNAFSRVATGSVDLPVLGNVPRIMRRRCHNLVRGTPLLQKLARRMKSLTVR
jgi:CelD/BcsL family acetyltransferase involved in cellulose biosynthesis